MFSYKYRMICNKWISLAQNVSVNSPLPHSVSFLGHCGERRKEQETFLRIIKAYSIQNSDRLCNHHNGDGSSVTVTLHWTSCHAKRDGWVTNVSLLFTNITGKEAGSNEQQQLNHWQCQVFTAVVCITETFIKGKFQSAVGHLGIWCTFTWTTERGNTESRGKQVTRWAALWTPKLAPICNAQWLAEAHLPQILTGCSTALGWACSPPWLRVIFPTAEWQVSGCPAENMMTFSRTSVESDSQQSTIFGSQSIISAG